jgi:hypothetical protein
MKKLPLLVAMLVSLLFTSSAFAAGYGAAGCGWGGKVVGKNSDILAQWGANILNGISYNQTFALSSGTSGCGKSGLVTAESEQTLFVANNYQSLVKQMAAGEGEDLATLAGLLGCAPDKAVQFGSFTQKNYGSIFASAEATPSQVLTSLKQNLSGDPTLSTTCSRI